MLNGLFMYVKVRILRIRGRRRRRGHDDGGKQIGAEWRE